MVSSASILAKFVFSFIFLRFSVDFEEIHISLYFVCALLIFLSIFVYLYGSKTNGNVKVLTRELPSTPFLGADPKGLS